MGRKHWALMVFSFLGAALVIWSETRHGQDAELAGHSLGLGRHRLRGSEVSGGTVSTGRLMTWPDDDPNDLGVERFSFGCVGTVHCPPPDASGKRSVLPPTEDRFDLTWTTLGFLSLIGVFNMAGAVSHRYSLYVTSSLSVQRIMFLSPPLQMLWLWMFADVSIAKPQILLMGTAIVLFANLGYQTESA